MPARDMVWCSRMPSHDEVNKYSAWWDYDVVPDLGLRLSAEYRYRVYVLECSSERWGPGPFYYVSIESDEGIVKTLGNHFTGKGRDFTKAHKPCAIRLAWPVTDTAGEAYVYMAMLRRMKAGTVHKLGGWVQTSIKPSPLQRLVLEQQRRQAQNVCFNCGDPGRDGRCGEMH